MSFLLHLFLVLHLVGMAIVLGGYFATLRDPGVYRGTFHGALTALIAGIAMVGIKEAQDSDLNHVKIAVKLVIALIVVALALFAKNRPESVKPAVKHAIGGLTLANVVIAVFW